MISRHRVALVVMALAVWGCGSTAPSPSPPTATAVVTQAPMPTATASPSPTPTPTPSPSPTPAPTASPSPSPVAPTIVSAAKAYLKVVTTYNKAMDAAKKKYGTQSTLASQRRFWAAMAKIEAAYLAGVKAIAFPPEVQGDAKALINATVVLQRRIIVASKSKTLGALLYNASLAVSAAQTSADKSAILRSDLGLPPPS